MVKLHCIVCFVWQSQVQRILRWAIAIHINVKGDHLYYIAAAKNEYCSYQRNSQNTNSDSTITRRQRPKQSWLDRSI